MTLELHPRVLELISSKICHDLVSPVGAIGNGVELIEEMGAGAMDDALSLISSSAQQAAKRLKFFRLAYGAAGTDANISFKDIKETFASWVAASVGDNIKVTFADDLPMKFSMPPKGYLKTVLNLSALAAECTHGNGEVLVEALSGKNGVRIVAKGAKVKFRDNAELALSGKISPDELDARSVHAYLSGKLLNYFSFQMTTSACEDGSEISMELYF